MVKVYFTVDAVKKFIQARSWAHIKVSAMFLFLLNEMKTNMLPTVSGRLCCLQAAGGMHSAACFLSLPDSSSVLSTTWLQWGHTMSKEIKFIPLTCSCARICLSASSRRGYCRYSWHAIRSLGFSLIPQTFNVMPRILIWRNMENMMYGVSMKPFWLLNVCGVCRAVRTPGHPSQCLASPVMALPQHNKRLRQLVVLVAILTTV